VYAACVQSFSFERKIVLFRGTKFACYTSAADRPTDEQNARRICAHIPAGDTTEKRACVCVCVCIVNRERGIEHFGRLSCLGDRRTNENYNRRVKRNLYKTYVTPERGQLLRSVSGVHKPPGGQALWPFSGGVHGMAGQ